MFIDEPCCPNVNTLNFSGKKNKNSKKNYDFLFCCIHCFHKQIIFTSTEHVDI